MRMTVDMLRQIIKEEVTRNFLRENENEKNPAYTTHATRILVPAFEDAVEATQEYKQYIKHAKGKEIKGGDYMVREMTKSFVPLLQRAVNLEDDYGGLSSVKAKEFLSIVRNNQEVANLFANEQLCSQVDWYKVVDALHDSINNLMPKIGSPDGPGGGDVSPFRGFGTRGSHGP